MGHTSSVTTQWCSRRCCTQNQVTSLWCYCSNANSTFTNTCPVMINYINDYATAANVTFTDKVLVADLFIGKPPTTNVLY